MRHYASCGDLTQQPVEYRMVVHLFGSTSLPSCASFCLRKTTLDNKGDFEHHVIDTIQEILGG